MVLSSWVSGKTTQFLSCEVTIPCEARLFFARGAFKRLGIEMHLPPQEEEPAEAST